MRLQRAVVRLREAVAAQQPDPQHARPTFVHLIFVGGWGNGRVDVEFEWIATPADARRCRVHTSTSDPRRAVREVLKVAEHVRAGRRFKASWPEAWDPYQ